MSVHQSAHELLQGIPVEMAIHVQTMALTQQRHHDAIERAQRLAQLEYNFQQERQVLLLLATPPEPENIEFSALTNATAPSSKDDLLFYQPSSQPLSPVKLHKLSSRQDIDNDDFDTDLVDVDDDVTRLASETDAIPKAPVPQSSVALSDQSPEEDMQTERLANGNDDEEGEVGTGTEHSNALHTQPTEVVNGLPTPPDTFNSPDQPPSSPIGKVPSDSHDNLPAVEVDVENRTARWQLRDDSDDNDDDIDDSEVDKAITPNPSVLSTTTNPSPPQSQPETPVSPQDSSTDPIHSPPPLTRELSSQNSLQHMLAQDSASHPDTSAVANDPTSSTGPLSPFSSRQFDPLASPFQDSAPARESLSTPDTREFDLMFSNHAEPMGNLSTTPRHLSLAHFDSLTSSNPYDDLNLASLDDVAILGSLMGYAPVVPLPLPGDDDPGSSGNGHGEGMVEEAEQLPLDDNNNPATDTATTASAPSLHASKPTRSTPSSNYATPDGTPVPQPGSASTTPSPAMVVCPSASPSTIRAAKPSDPTSNPSTTAPVTSGPNPDSPLFLGADPGYFTQTYGQRRTSISSACSSDDEFGLKQAGRNPQPTQGGSASASTRVDADKVDQAETITDNQRAKSFIEMGFEEGLVRQVLKEASSDDGEVVSQLFAIQPLLEAGFETDHVVRATRQCQDPTVLQTVLEAAPQLLAMGFGVDASLQALVASNGDIGQAIDIVSKA
eukprot:m.191666 g.191666  ORF g.191666 m.191666 type:complete len:724 (+) comp16956_c0_seq2:2221-4392(+)